MTMTAEQLAQTIRPDLEMLCSSEELTADRREALARIVEHLTPPNLLALLDELERKDALIDEQDKRLVDYAAIATKSSGRVAELEKKSAFLKEKLAQLANFNPDWDMLEATTDSLREHMSELTAANKRIAELEARHTKLRESMAAIHNTIRLDGVGTSLSGLLSASKRAWEESAPDAGINLTVEG
ncbi:hypothetical protein [Atlantibacter subterraneus]|uniref:hypothetical protein n=1 Tax=Atlantibacter subterraneus TaxID=255519 RepID=UPI0029656826|nr:hypothetical protein [Atlantibacter subterranea]MDW2743679.1 hypothetical protein [Atlantibacter subterranea]